MTRINCGIPVEDLVDKHLLAEHYELIRIPNAVRTGKAKLNAIPTKFRLGTGHVTFFYNKLQYLKTRYYQIHEECKRRGFNVQDFSSSFDGIPERLMKDYFPTEDDIKIMRERIADMTKPDHKKTPYK